MLGDEFCKERLGLTEEQLNDWNFSLLRDGLGFSTQQIEEASAHICGRMTVEGAPYLKDEHLAVFDCATPCGTLRLPLHPSARARRHDGFRATVGFSGAIRKTINLPQNGHDCRRQGGVSLFVERMIKAVALYRDGSKLSQPLAASYDFGGDATEEEADGARSAAAVYHADADRREAGLSVYRNGAQPTADEQVGRRRPRPRVPGTAT